MKAALATAAQTWIETGEALRAALASGDAAPLESAREARAHAFDQLAALAQRAPRDSALRELLARLAAHDAETLALLRGALEGTRGALAQLAEGRRLLAALQGDAEPPRFLSRRV